MVMSKLQICESVLPPKLEVIFPIIILSLRKKKNLNIESEIQAKNLDSQNPETSS